MLYLKMIPAEWDLNAKFAFCFGLNQKVVVTLGIHFPFTKCAQLIYSILHHLGYLRDSTDNTDYKTSICHYI